MNEPWFYAVWTVGAYLLGSLSIGDLVARAAGVKIRDLGTGNPGTANIFREMGPKFAVAVFTLDVAKGAAATVPLYLLDLPAWAGLPATAGVLAGHFFPLFWRFQGGTGLVVGMGAAVGLLPLGVMVAAPITAATARLTRNTGVAGGVFFVASMAAGWLVHRDALAVLAVLLIGMAVYVKSMVQYGHWRKSGGPG